MRRDADIMREDGPTIFAAVKHGKGIEDIVDLILGAWRVSGADRLSDKGKGKGKEP